MIQSSDFLPDRLMRSITTRAIAAIRRTHGAGVTLPQVDPIADVLDLSRVRGAWLTTVYASVPWGLDFPRTNGASLLAVSCGPAWLGVERDEPLLLKPGDVVLLPSGIRHRLSPEPDGRCQPFDRRLKEQRMTPEGDVKIGGEGARTVFLCSGYDYDLAVAQPLMSLLPPVMHVPAEPARAQRVAMIVELLADEVGGHGQGSRAAAARLLDLLLIEAIRHWAFRDQDAGGPSWLTALRDPTIATALALLHARPAEPWTLERLAREAHLSRTTLARKFTEAVGEPPLAYLTRWRMHLAAARLKHTTDTVEKIAREVGYTSEHAFNRAFARHHGHPPGRYRQLGHTAQGEAPDVLPGGQHIRGPREAATSVSRW
jgi:AraC-like DNA-binding protein